MIKPLVLGVLRLYQVGISPYFPACCRYSPTCSQYGYEAVTRYGPVKGIKLILKRFVRCNPLGNRGYDPVP